MYQFEQVASMTTPAMLAAVAEAFPDRSFVIADDGELSYREMAVLCADLAAGFAALGLQPGERIGILLPNGLRWCATFLGAHAAGLTVVPLNTWYRRDELASAARRTGLRTIITQSELFGFESGSAAADLDMPGYLGALLWPTGTARPGGLPTARRCGKPTAELNDSPADETADALVIFTSGSSAEPKAVRLTQGGLVRTGHAIGERQGVVGGDRFWFGSPLFFVFGCANALPNALTHAATLCLQERFEARSALEFIERHRCTVYYGVGPITRALAGCEDLPLRDISTLRTGTANATPDDLRLAIDVLGVQQVCNAYGMSETYGHTTITAHTDPAHVRIGGQGTVLPTQQLRIVADGAVAAPETPGEIQIRGLISPGYLDDSDANTRAFDHDGWFQTGDLGLLDAAGRLRYLGRRDDTMKVRGINISPLEIELLLVQHEMVDEAFVFGLATAEGDQSVGCVLVSSVSPQHRGRLQRDVQAWTRQHVASYKIPTTIRIITADELPLTPTGKVNKRVLKEQTQASVAG